MSGSLFGDKKMKTAVHIECNNFFYGNADSENESTPKNTVLENFSLDINYGEVTLISGASGSGKSTLISLINGVIPRVVPGVFNGKIFIDGEDASEKSMSSISLKVGSVLQNAESQIINQIVEDEIAFGAENLGFSASDIAKNVNESCSLMKLEPQWKTRTLSGGQKQRVVTASTLCMKPDIFIFDEPLANLDVTGAKILLDLLKDLCFKGKAIVLVEHRLDIVLPYVDKIYKIENKKASLVENKKEYLKSQTEIFKDTKENCITTSDIALQLCDITKSFGKRNILCSLNETIYKGERILLTGENGSGKSTLMNIIARLTKQDSGKVIQHFDKRLKNKKASSAWFKMCGLVYQNPNYQLFMSSVKDEILFGAEKTDEGKLYALEIAKRLELESLLNRHPQSLSEGQKRRVTVAAILAQRPKLLLLDEPTVGQDYHTLELLMQTINDVHREEGTTVISITHDIRCQNALCDRRLLLKDGKF